MSNRHTHILLIEDSPAYALLVNQLLSSATVPEFEVEHVDCLAVGLERLTRDGIDVVVTDLGLPDAQGLESVQAIVAQFPALPVLVLTAV